MTHGSQGDRWNHRDVLHDIIRTPVDTFDLDIQLSTDRGIRLAFTHSIPLAQHAAAASDRIRIAWVKNPLSDPFKCNTHFARAARDASDRGGFQYAWKVLIMLFEMERSGLSKRSCFLPNHSRCGLLEIGCSLLKIRCGLNNAS